MVTGHIHKDKERWHTLCKANSVWTCNAIGYKFIPTNELAGLRFKAPSAKWAVQMGLLPAKKA